MSSILSSTAPGSRHKLHLCEASYPDRHLLWVEAPHHDPRGCCVDRAELLEALNAVERKEPCVAGDTEDRFEIADRWGDALKISRVGGRLYPMVESIEGRRSVQISVGPDEATALRDFLNTFLGTSHVEPKKPRTETSTEGGRLILADAFGDKLDIGTIAGRVMPQIEDREGESSVAVDLDLDQQKALYHFLGRHLREQGVELEAPKPKPHFEILRQHPNGHFLVVAEVAWSEAAAAVEAATPGDGGDTNADDIPLAAVAVSGVDWHPGELAMARFAGGRGVTIVAIGEERRPVFTKVEADPAVVQGVPLTAEEKLTLGKAATDGEAGEPRCCDEVAAANGMGA